jgi:site-specific DNA-methyltransferase (adenine-specific)
LVADPFMGSGSVGVAAVRSGRNFIGNDLCAEAVEITRARLIEAGARDGDPLQGNFGTDDPQQLELLTTPRRAR